MALIAMASDKGSPGVTTASVALAAVWPRPVLLAECDPAGGDLVYRLPAADGGRLDPRRGLLNLAVAARRGLQPRQVWEHSQKLHGGLDVLVGVNGAEQGTGLDLLWGAVGKVLAAVPQADVIADCGRLGADGPVYDLLAYAACVVLLARPTVGEVTRLRDRAAAVTAALGKRGRSAARINVVVVTDYRNITSTVEEVGHALRHSGASARVMGGLAYEPKSAERLRGQWGGRLDKSMLIRTARGIAAELASDLPGLAAAEGPSPAAPEQQPASSPPPAGQGTSAPQPQHQPAVVQEPSPPSATRKPPHSPVAAATPGAAHPAATAATPSPAHPAVPMTPREPAHPAISVTPGPGHPGVAAAAPQPARPAVPQAAPGPGHPGVPAAAPGAARPAVPQAAPGAGHPAVPAATQRAGHPGVPAATPRAAHPASQAPVTGPQDPSAIWAQPTAQTRPARMSSSTTAPQPAGSSPHGRHAGAPAGLPQGRPQSRDGDQQQATRQPPQPAPTPCPPPRQAEGR